MLKRYQRTVGDLFRICDVSIVVGAWLLAYWWRFYWSPIEVTKGLPEFSTYAALSPLIAILWLVTFSQMRVYASRRLVGRADEILLVLKAHGFSLLLFVALTYAFEDYKYSRIVMAFFAVMGGVGLAVARVFLRGILRIVRARGFNLRHVLMVGQPPELANLIERLERYPEMGMSVAGVLTSKNATFRKGSEVFGKPVLGSYQEIAEVVAEHQVDEVMIILGPREAEEVDLMLDQLKDEPVALRLVPDVQRYVTLGCDVENFDGLPIVRLNDSPLLGGAALLKRTTDLGVAALALVILAPLMGLLALAVKLTSRGPIFYGQERCGLDGRSFVMYKFRSMKVDAEQKTGAVWATKGDDRRTPIGAFLRKTSLDELPQFWNVLRGEMSLVGPRPERPVFVREFRDRVPHYMLRHKVKAGITGWAQVNGWRGDTSIDARIECDLFYIKHWSYLFDLQIILMTLWKGFVHKNAY